jgi:hypothetical protein
MPKQRIPLVAVRRQWMQRIRSTSIGSDSLEVWVERHGDDSDALRSGIENLIQEGDHGWQRPVPVEQHRFWDLGLG